MMDPVQYSMLFTPDKIKSRRQVIEINNLGKGFGTQEVLKNVTLQLFDGENLAILGRSGSGKSVLIKCIVRLINPDHGTINVSERMSVH